MVIASFKDTNPFALWFSSATESKMDHLLDALARQAEAPFSSASGVHVTHVFHAFGDIQALMGTAIWFI